jgi:hypothetical protein
MTAGSRRDRLGEVNGLAAPATYLNEAIQRTLSIGR